MTHPNEHWSIHKLTFLNKSNAQNVRYIHNDGVKMEINHQALSIKLINVQIYKTVLHSYLEQLPSMHHHETFLNKPSNLCGIFCLNWWWPQCVKSPHHGLNVLRAHINSWKPSPTQTPHFPRKLSWEAVWFWSNPDAMWFFFTIQLALLMNSIAITKTCMKT